MTQLEAFFIVLGFFGLRFVLPFAATLSFGRAITYMQDRRNGGLAVTGD